MVHGAIRSICLGMIAGMALSSSPILAQAPVSKVITWQPPAAGTVHVGILGEIARPGVYVVDSQGLSLQSVIRRAGGLTDGASGTIRIVRQDRVVESVYFTSQTTNSPLLANDLLIVESQQARAAVARYFDADPQTRDQSPLTIRGTDPQGIQVAFVNILDRPVVVRIKHEQAQLSQIVQKLAQPQELAQSVRVIGPERGIAQGSRVDPAASLSDGSVLVFPRQAVNRAKLPVLPSAYDSEIASGAVPSLIGGPTGQSAELRNVGQLPPLVARQMPEVLPQVPVLPEPVAPRPSALPMTPATESTIPEASPEASRIEIPPAQPSVPLVHSQPRIATLPFAGQPRITSSSQQSVQAEPVTPTPRAALPERSAEPVSRSLEPTASRSPDSDPEPDPLDEVTPQDGTGGESRLSIPQMLGIVITVGLLIGLALATRALLNRQLPRRSRAVFRFDPSQPLTDSSGPHVPMVASENPTADTAPVVEPVSATTEAVAAADMPITAEDSWLNKVLANALPITDEKPVFPSPILLQGQIAPPPVFRVDAAETPMRGPHFATSTNDTGATDADAPASQQMIDEFDEPHASGPARPHFLKSRPSVRTVAAAAAAASRNRPLDAPPSPTPVTDALRQLQGGQS